MSWKELLEYDLLTLGGYQLNVYHILFWLVVFGVTRLLLWLVSLYLSRKVKQGKLDDGKRYAIYQVLKYLGYVIAIAIGLESLGIKLTVLLAGSTALLVGLGLGLQDFFRDLVAGFIILTERVITAGDVVEIGGTVGRVQEVGLRTSTVITRDDIVLIIPNQKLTTDRVINWSQNRRSTRFSVEVGVAYGSDTEKVRDLLLQVVRNHPQVVHKQEATVFFRDFGDSSLNFSVLFHSNELFRIERVKSDIRFAIDKAFRENNVVIPFPQRDLWVKELPKSSGT